MKPFNQFPIRSLVVALALLAPLAAPTLGCNGTTSGPGGGSVVPDGEAGLVGKAAPELEVEAVAGDGPKSLAEARGTVTIVDFWGTFCKPCKESFPKYQELVDTNAGKLFVLAVSVDDPEDAQKEQLAEFAKQTNVSFPILWDKSKKTAAAYPIPKMPTSYVIDKKGIVRHMHAGYSPDEAEHIAKEVEALIAE
ncbi:MAG: TlpA family protein disulfide reductase [Myxococcales bacterium]|nr:TlpA family protein disulfide reductase [Myxococcales bacterium]